MPAEIFGPDYAFLSKKETLADKEIVFIARSFAELGIRKIRITGGEPLLRPNLDKLIAQIVSETNVCDISLTTNGSLLPRYADKLKAAGLNRINISLDSLDTIRFSQMNGNRSTPETVLKGIDAAGKAGLNIKINMVAKRGFNEVDILPMVDYFRKRKITLRFIEYMDVGESNKWKLNQVVPAKQILDLISSKHAFEPIDPDYKGEVATRYKFMDTKSEFGIITSITNPFCQDCNRVRLSANGKLYTCLFSNAGTDLKEIVRKGISQPDFTQLISKIWLGRNDQYSEERNEQKANKTQKVEMSYIGG